MSKEKNKFFVTFKGKYDYGVFTSETFEGNTLREAYEKLLKSKWIKST